MHPSTKFEQNRTIRGGVIAIQIRLTWIWPDFKDSSAPWIHDASAAELLIIQQICH